MESLWKSSLVAAIFLVTVTQIAAQVDLDELKAKLPPGTIPAELQNVSLPIEQTLNAIKDKCTKESGDENSYQEVMEASTKLQECLNELLNWNELQEEIEAAKPTGDLETVFNKYCKRRHTAIDCVTNFTETLGSCLSEKENKDKYLIVDVVKTLLSFVCHKEGDQIALFIAEKGPECFTEKKDELVSCMNKTYGHYMPADMNVDNLPKEVPEFTFGDKQCEDMDDLQDCVVKVLSNCEETTPANLVESAFKFIRNETPCKNVTNKYLAAQRSGSDMSLKMALTTLLSSTSLAFLLTLL